jgi:hypothetical protein
MTTHQAAPLATNEVTRVADAFRPATLAHFAQRPSGAHLFRVQHEHLAQLMHRVIVGSEGTPTGESAVDARSALTTLTSLLAIHQSLEESLVHRSLAAEPRARMAAEQFEREMVPLMAELGSLARRYPTASSIFHGVKGEFAAAATHLFARLQERFRREERDLFPVFDRVTTGTLPVAA